MNQKVVFYTVYIKKNGWNISAYSTPKPTSDNFLDLLKISDADRMFVEENIRNSQRELFLLKSGKRCCPICGRPMVAPTIRLHFFVYVTKYIEIRLTCINCS